LAKRHGDTRLVYYRDRGVPAERILGLLAFWSGMLDNPAPMTANEFADQFDLTALPTEPVTFTEDEATWVDGG